jgi:hypothetical protein
MTIEVNVIISILKLTKEGPVSKELVKKEAHVAASISEKLLGKLQSEALINVDKTNLTVNGSQRLRLAVCAIQSGADLESVAGFLQWKEFEDMAAVAFERNGFKVAMNVRFKHAGRKWEIDVVGCKKPLAICLDCKHWHRGMSPSALKRIVEEQVGRALALSKHLPSPSLKIECALWNSAKFIPAVLSLVAGRFKFYDDVPVVPVLQLQDFLNQLPAYANSLKHFSKGTATLGLDHDFSQGLL